MLNNSYIVQVNWLLYATPAIPWRAKNCIIQRKYQSCITIVVSFNLNHYDCSEIFVYLWRKLTNNIMKAKKSQTLWAKLLKVAIALLLTVGTSRIATNDPVIDSAVRTAIETTGEVIISALSSDSAVTY